MLAKWLKMKQRAAAPTERHDINGNEIPDPTPVELPAGFARPDSIHELIAKALRGQQVMQAQLARGEETLEDSMDFDVGEDDTPITPHEYRDMQEDNLREGAKEARRAARKPVAASGGKPSDPPSAPPGKNDPEAPEEPV